MCWICTSICFTVKSKSEQHLLTFWSTLFITWTELFITGMCNGLSTVPMTQQWPTFWPPSTWQMWLVSTRLTPRAANLITETLVSQNIQGTAAPSFSNFGRTQILPSPSSRSDIRVRRERFPSVITAPPVNWQHLRSGSGNQSRSRMFLPAVDSMMTTNSSTRLFLSLSSELFLCLPFMLSWSTWKNPRLPSTPSPKRRKEKAYPNLFFQSKSMIEWWQISIYLHLYKAKIFNHSYWDKKIDMNSSICKMEIFIFYNFCSSPWHLLSNFTFEEEVNFEFTQNRSIWESVKMMATFLTFLSHAYNSNIHFHRKNNSLHMISRP